MPDVLSRITRRLGRGWRRATRTALLIPEALEAVVLLPRQLELIAFHTATLQEMHAEIAAVRGDTERMALLLGRVDANTASVERLAEIAVPLEGAAARLGRLADRWPAPRTLRGG
jgi:hypothetical protein